MKEGIDYYIDENGLFVFTASFHLDRGYCCGRGCKHCPYDYINVPDVKRARLLKERADNAEDKR